MSICLRASQSNVPRKFIQSFLRNGGSEVRLFHRTSHVTRLCHVTSVARLHQCRNGDISLSVRTVDQSNRCVDIFGLNIPARHLSTRTRANPEQIALAQQYLEQHGKKNRKFRDWMMITISILLLMFGVSAASVPLYKVFCSATGYGGTTKKHSEEDNAKVKTMLPVDWRPVTVTFTSTVNPGLDWEFTPVQNSVSLVPGETCLAFFTAKNNSARVITGISTYNVTPFEAGAYFNKIQCFCFDEQTLNPGEELDMPVFFYIDPEFVLDPDLIRNRCHDVQLHYTFFDTDQEHSRFQQLSKDITAFFNGERMTPAEFNIPESDEIVIINDEVYKTILRKGYEKEFVEPGTTVVCHVTGFLPDEEDKVFWSTKGGNPFTYKAGIGTVIDGWDEGVEGMSEGEISKIYMSSNKGYGKIGNRSWNIPGHTNIAFEIEILAVR
ncbi:uncharacterized protein LOC134823549 isoform X2 [Bolinopsis microptera]